jgi:hypothetical protein
MEKQKRQGAIKVLPLSRVIYETATPVAVYKTKELLPKARLGVAYIVKLLNDGKEVFCMVSRERAKELFPELLILKEGE